MNVLNKAIELQKKYESGEIKASEMTDEQYALLQKLYNVQIYKTDRESEEYEKEIEKYKKEILKLKKHC